MATSVYEKRVLELLREMLSHPDELTDITWATGEYYFKYKEHAFSVIERTNEDEDWGRYSIYIYPGYRGDLQLLAQLSTEQPEQLKMATFHSSASMQMQQSLAQLYDLVKNKDLDLDSVLDDILGKDIPF